MFFISFFATLCDLWDLSSLTGGEARPSGVRVLSPNHWTPRALPQ